MPILHLDFLDNISEDIHYDEADVIEVERCDFVSSKIGSVTRTDEGYLRGVVPVAKVGILRYLLPDGSIRREFVSPEVLFNTDSISTFKMQPITDTHPPEILLDSRTVKRRRIGTTGENIVRQDDFLMVPIAITDSDGIASVEGGRRQFSPGYRCLLAKKDGFYKGEPYDAIQIKRTYNHLALCDKARGGSDLKLAFDSLSIEEVDKIDGFEINPQTQKEYTTMPKYRIDGIDYEAAQEVINLLTKLQSKADSLAAEVQTHKNSADASRAKTDELKERVDALEKRDVKAEVTAGVKNRLNLIKVAGATLDEDVLKNLDSMDDAAIKKAVILAKSPKANLDGQTDVYVQARFDSILETLDFDPTALAESRKKSASRSDGDNLDPVEKARIDSEKRILEGHINFGK